MELRVLRYFVSVVEQGSLTGGAAALHISQPTVSRQIQSLELELGISLFERGRGALRLTHAGRIFHRMAVDIVRREDSARDVLRGMLGRADHRLTVLAPLATIYSSLGPFLASHGADQPIVDAVETEPLQVFDQVARHGADLGISTLPPPLGWRSIHVGTLPVRAHVTPDHPLATAATVELRDLVEHPLIVLDRSTAGRVELDRALAAARIEPARLIELTSSIMAQGIARGRGWVAVLSAASAHGLIPVPVVSAGAPLHVECYAGWEASHFASDVISDFVEDFRAWSVSAGDMAMEVRPETIGAPPS